MSGSAGVGHLSIGEVLSLVQQDFPDVTISKIRFLESQGLIAPERTAAGYRKFYDSDIERLRWILRQQRDHFLPLKVIRKMLDQGVDVSPEAQPTLWSAAASGPASEEAVGGDTAEDDDGRTDTATGGAVDSTELGAQHTIDVTDAAARRTAEVPREGGRRRSGGDRTDEEQGRGDSGREERPEEERHRSPAHPAVASARPRTARRAGGTSDSRPAAPSSPATGSAPGGRSSEGLGSGPSSGHSDAEPTSPAGEEGDSGGETPRPTYSTPADVVAALQEEPRSRRRHRASREETEQPAEPAPAAPAARPSAPPREIPAGVRMTRGELCETAGIGEDLLADLEQFGLVTPTVLGGDPQYDGMALEVARMAARYAELGVGARHLRMYKVSAEREAGFVEQLVVPLLKQRNPSAREEAEQRADELQRMGADLHSMLLRRRLGPSFGS